MKRVRYENGNGTVKVLRTPVNMLTKLCKKNSPPVKSDEIALMVWKEHVRPKENENKILKITNIWNDTETIS